MRIAILGANSHIAKDLIKTSMCDEGVDFYLFVRNITSLDVLLAEHNALLDNKVQTYDDFVNSSAGSYDAIINFVGSGNPAQTERMGATILDITYEFDELSLQYVKKNPGCRYIFLSSGAVYGGGFESPANDQTCTSYPLNQLGSQDWYGLSKMFAEARHRALSDLPIVDLRIFNYFSYSADIEARFLITDVLRAIRDGLVLQTSHENIVRDYSGPQEIAQLIQGILAAPPCNTAVDCFTRSPVDKLSMLESMKNKFGLQYELVERKTGLVSTGAKLNYYSKSRKATELFGYVPQKSSLDVVLEQAKSFFK